VPTLQISLLSIGDSKQPVKFFSAAAEDGKLRSGPCLIPRNFLSSPVFSCKEKESTMIKRTMPARADADTQDGFSNDAPAAPKTGRSAKTSEGQKSGKGPKPSPATEKVSGAGPAIAEHSKDAKMKAKSKGGLRQGWPLASKAKYFFGTRIQMRDGWFVGGKRLD
jgi:hypothetical protein